MMKIGTNYKNGGSHMRRVIDAPSTYIQGPGEIKKLAEHYRSIGEGEVLLIMDRFVHDVYRDAAAESFEKEEISWKEEVFTGECCEPEITRLAGLAENCGAVFGIGGGKVQDTAKAAGHYSGKPVILVPTAVSTDAPCSRIAVLYQEDGTFDRYLSLKRNPDLIILDTEIIAHAPVRLFTAGMGDAISTYYEAFACRRNGAVTRAGGSVSIAAEALAKACLDTVLTYGEQARKDVENRLCTEAVENIVEANTYLSGIGFESGGAGLRACASQRPGPSSGAVFRNARRKGGVLYTGADGAGGPAGGGDQSDSRLLPEGRASGLAGRHACGRNPGTPSVRGRGQKLLTGRDDEKHWQGRGAGGSGEGDEASIKMIRS